MARRTSSSQTKSTALRPFVCAPEACAGLDGSDGFAPTVAPSSVACRSEAAFRCEPLPPPSCAVGAASGCGAAPPECATRCGSMSTPACTTEGGCATGSDCAPGCGAGLPG